MANSERPVERDKGLSCGMYDRKNEHGVNIHALGDASGGLRGWRQTGDVRADRAGRWERKKKG